MRAGLHGRPLQQLCDFLLVQGLREVALPVVGDWFHLAKITLLVEHEAAILVEVDVAAAASQGLPIITCLPFTEGERAFELGQGVIVALRGGGATTKHVVHVHDHHATKTVRAQQMRCRCSRVKLRVELAFIHEEATRILRMLFQTHALQLVHGGQVPGSWGIYLTLAWLQ